MNQLLFTCHARSPPQKGCRQSAVAAGVVGVMAAPPAARNIRKRALRLPGRFGSFDPNEDVYVRGCLFFGVRQRFGGTARLPLSYRRVRTTDSRFTAREPEIDTGSDALEEAANSS